MNTADYKKTQKSSLPCWQAEAGILWNRRGGTFTVWTARVAFVNSAMKIRLPVYLTPYAEQSSCHKG